MTLPLTQRPAWHALTAHRAAVGARSLRDLFAADPARGERMTAEACGVFLDYSKNKATAETLKLLVTLAEECGLKGKMVALLTG